MAAVVLPSVHLTTNDSHNPLLESTTTTTAPDAPENPPPSDIFSITDQELKDRLHFIREIGFGNWGSVWSCYTKDSPIREKVAVKLVHREKTPTTTARVRSLWNEMKIHRSFKNDTHPSIVAFHSFVITPSFALITMEYLPRLIPVEVHESKAKGWFESLVGGVHFLHSHRVSHNDIKPANILLTATLVPVLVDFGFAEHYSSHKTPKDKMFLSNLAYGTPEYLSPERAKGLTHDTRLSDMYSLGVTFFEILIGRTPFEEVEGEVFETQTDLERYWERTKAGVWLGEEDWKGKMSTGMHRLLKKMMNPDAAGRVTASKALSDPYWRTSHHPVGDTSYLATPPGIVSVPRGVSDVRKSADASILDNHAKATDEPVKVPVAKAPATKKKSKNKIRKQKSHSTSQSPPKPAPATASKARAALTAPRGAPVGFSIPAMAPALASPRPAPSGIPVPKRRQPPKAAAGDSDKENGGGKGGPSKTSVVSPAASQLSFHFGRKVPTRKPIPAVLQPHSGHRDENVEPPIKGRTRVASIVNKSAIKAPHARPMSATVGNVSRTAVQKHLEEKSGLGIEKKEKEPERKVLMDLTGMTSRGRVGSVKIDQKSVLDVVKDVKASMMKERAKLRLLEEQQECPAADVSASTADDSFNPDTSEDLPTLFPNDTFPRAGKESTPISIFKHSVRLSMDKLAFMSSIGRQSRISVQEIPQSYEEIPMPSEEVDGRPSGDSEVDRMTVWIRNVEKVVEETRTNFQQQNDTQHARLPSLPPRMIQTTPSRRALNKVHPILVVNSPGGRRRRATVGELTAPSVPLGPAEGEQEASPTKNKNRGPLARSVSVMAGHISPIANLEQELLKPHTSAPQRLSAVIDAAGFAAQLLKMKMQLQAEERRSADTEAPSVVEGLPTIEVTVNNVSPPPSPPNSINDARRKSASSLMLRDRPFSSSTLDFGANTVEGGLQQQPQSPPPPQPNKDYDRLLMSTSGVSRLGRGYQSDWSMRKLAAPVESKARPPADDAAAKQLRRRSIFKGLAAPVANPAKTCQSFDDIGARRQHAAEAAQARAPAPANLKVPTTETVTSRVRKAFQNILLTPRRARTFTSSPRQAT